MNFRRTLVGITLLAAVALGTISCAQYENKAPQAAANTPKKTATSNKIKRVQAPPIKKVSPYQKIYDKAKALVDSGEYLEAVKVIETIPPTADIPYDGFVAGDSYGDHTKPQSKYYNMEGMGYVESLEFLLESRDMESAALLRKYLIDGTKVK